MNSAALRLSSLPRRYCVHTAGRYRKIGRAGQEKDGKIRKKRIWKKITRQVRNQKKPARLRTLNSQQIYLYRARKRCLRIKKGIKQLCTTSTFRSNTRHS